MITPRKILIDYVMDVFCPWCFVATRNLSNAINSIGSKYNIKNMEGNGTIIIDYKPFLLYPWSAPRCNRMDYYAKKFGTMQFAVDKFQSEDGQIKIAGKKAGINFSFMKGDTGTSVPAHKLIRIAEKLRNSEAFGKKDVTLAVAEKLMSTYFEHDEYIGDMQVLEKIAKECGLADTEEWKAFKADPDSYLTKELEPEVLQSKKLGSVPHMTLKDGETGETIGVVPGGIPQEEWEAILEDLLGLDEAEL